MRELSAVRGALALVALLLAAPFAAAHQYVATVTLAEGQNTLISREQAYVPAAGVWLHHCDVVETGAQGFVQLETDDGGMIELGPLTRFIAHLPALHGQAPLVGPQYVLAGWVKLTVPKRPKGLPHRLDTPLFDVTVDNGIVVLQVAEDGARFFVESGEAIALDRSGTAAGRVVVRAGTMYSRKQGLDRGSVIRRAAPDFVKAMPPAFRDTLRSRLAKLKVRNVEAKPAPAPARADVEAWLTGDVDVRRACAGRH